MKACRICKEIKSLDLYYNNARNSDKKQSRCKSCHHKENTKWFKDNKELVYERFNSTYGPRYKERNPEASRTRVRDWYRSHPQIRNHNSNLYKAAKLQRVPKWADLEAIKEFYLNCPEGHHVDHIIPLRGKTASGLHVIENLQYLTAEENLKKGNRLPEEVIYF